MSLHEHRDESRSFANHTRRESCNDLPRRSHERSINTWQSAEYPSELMILKGNKQEVAYAFESSRSPFVGIQICLCSRRSWRRKCTDGSCDTIQEHHRYRFPSFLFCIENELIFQGSSVVEVNWDLVDFSIDQSETAIQRSLSS